jgi:hypothetical protein
MSSQTDLKALWHLHKIPLAPPAQELIKKGRRQLRVQRRRTWVANITVISSLGVVIIELVKTWSKPGSLPIIFYLAMFSVSTYAVSTTRFLLVFYKANPAASTMRFIQGMIGFRKKQYVIQRLLILFYFMTLFLVILLHYHPLAEKTTWSYILVSSLIWIVLTAGFVIYIHPIINRRFEINTDILLEQWQEQYDRLKE